MVKSGPSYTPNGSVSWSYEPGGMRKFAYFKMSAEFVQDESQGKCASCCEIRQLIKWRTASQRPPRFAPPSEYPPGVFYEDRDDDGFRYGYRDCAETPGDMYTQANRPCGKKYDGYDRPSVRSDYLGTWIYRLQVVDVCNGGVVKETEGSQNVSIMWD